MERNGILEKLSQQGEGKRPNLLEKLKEKTGCTYLSDLHSPDLLPAIQEYLKDISPESWELQEWNDAVTYITGERKGFTDGGEALQFLIDYK